MPSLTHLEMVHGLDLETPSNTPKALEVSSGGLVGGGMDDRFDFVLSSQSAQEERDYISEVRAPSETTVSITTLPSTVETIIFR